jgi:hypothetical protein
MNSTYLLRTSPEILIYLRELTNTIEGYDYLNKVYATLLNLNKGNSIIIDKLVKAANIERFVKCVCIFMYERPYYGIQFSNDYLEVIRK